MDCFNAFALSFGERQVVASAPRNDEKKKLEWPFVNAAKLRSILAGSSCVRPGSVYDATSIRIAEDLGFELGMFGGSVLRSPCSAIPTSR